MEKLSIPAYEGAERGDFVEIMDNLSMRSPELGRALLEIEMINRRLGGTRNVIMGLSKLLHRMPRPFSPQRKLRIIDLGSGAGDIPYAISKFLSHSGIDHEIEGWDANSYITEFARNRYPTSEKLQFYTRDAFQPPEGPVDIVISSLFLHHFSTSQIEELWKNWYSHLRIGWIVNDLERNFFAYHLFRTYTFVTSAGSMARYDGAVSIMRAFKREEIAAMASHQPWKFVSLQKVPFFRWRLIASKH